MPSKKILAHRGNLYGPDPRIENTVEAYRAALEAGFGLEIDVRRSSAGEFYISHDPAQDRCGLSLDKFESIFRAHPECMIAVNVKELGYELALAELVASGIFGAQAFLFDFELLEPQTPGRAQRQILSVYTGVCLASRLSDRNEPLEQSLGIPGDIVWGDEFDAPWLTEQQVAAVQQTGRRFCVVSPELHGASSPMRLARWVEMKNWRIDALCTDFSFEARAFFSA